MGSADSAHAATIPRWHVRLAAITKRGDIATISSAIIKAWTRKGEVTLQAGGQTFHLTASGLLSLRRTAHSAKAATSEPAPWWLQLRTGDLLPGEPLRSRAEMLVFHSMAFGTIQVPLDDVAALSRTKTAAYQTASAHDHLRFINGDTLSGAMLRFSPPDVTWNSSLGTIHIPLTRIRTITLAQTLPPPIPHGPLIRLTGTDGTVLTTSGISWQKNQLRLTPVELTTLSCAMNAVRKIDIVGGNITWLTTMTPNRYVQTPYVGSAWPLMENKNCVGHALRADGKVFRHGLGVHVAAKLSYDLADRCASLTFIPAMDHSARPWGAGTVSVLADGRRIFTSDILTPGTDLHPVMLNVHGVKTLEFQITGANVFGVRGRVDLLDAALLK